MVREVEATATPPNNVVLRLTPEQVAEISAAIAAAMAEDLKAKAGRFAGEFVGGVLDEVLRGQRKRKLPKK